MTNTVTCSACGNDAPCTQQKRLPDQGWELPFDVFGYYYGFSDEISVLIGDRRSRIWIMCHDCVAKFLDTFPLLAATLGKGLHPHYGDSDEPCCEYAWRATDKFAQYERDDDGELVPVRGAKYQVVQSGKWIDAPDDENE